MQRNHAELILECQKLGIPLDPTKVLIKGKKGYGKKDLVDLLAAYFLAKIQSPSWGLLARLKVQSPMLCFAYWHLTPQQKAEINSSPDWVAEEKWDGCRLWMTYHPKEGLGFFGRNVSVEDYLPVDYTSKVLLIVGGVVRKPSDFINAFPTPFILDTEVLCDETNLDTSLFSTGAGTTTGTELNAVTALLSINAEASHKLQIGGATLRFKALDLPFDEFWRVGAALRARMPLREARVEAVRHMIPITSSTAVSVVSGGGQKLFDDVVAAGGEGIVYKNLSETYIITDSRPRTTQVKRKITVGEESGSDIDAFITGFVPSDQDKGWKDYIGAFKLSVNLRSEDGTSVEHYLASVGSMPMTVRQEASHKDAEGKISLNPDFLGRVLVINGQDLSPKAHRFMHATIDWKRGFRKDKSPELCVMEKSFMLSQIK